MTWTVDADGNFVDWLKPPYWNEEKGIVTLLLEGEDFHDQEVQQKLAQRTVEFSRLRLRQLRQNRAEHPERRDTRTPRQLLLDFIAQVRVENADNQSSKL